MKFLLVVFPVLLAIASASPVLNHRPFEAVWSKRGSKRESSGNLDSFTVDLGYERYRGVSNVTTGLNIFKG